MSDEPVKAADLVPLPLAPHFDPDVHEVEIAAQELCEVFANEFGYPYLWDMEVLQRDAWRAVAKRVLEGRYWAAHLAEAVQLHRATETPERVALKKILEVIALGDVRGSRERMYKLAAEALLDGPLEQAWLAYVRFNPHDRVDCPCGHPPGEQGVCGGCNCADGEP